MTQSPVKFPDRGPVRTDTSGEVVRLLRLALAIALVGIVLWVAGGILLAIFAGIMLSILLDGLAKWVSRGTPLPRSWALAMVIAVLVAAVIGGAFWLTPGVAGHAYQLFSNLAKAVDHMSQTLSKYFPNVTIPPSQLPTASALAAPLLGVTSTFTGVLVNAAIVVFVGFYGAIQPSLYVDGFTRLFPLHRRARVKEILREIGRTLQWWLLARAITMTAVGVLILIGLWALGVPSFAPLALFAGLMTFIPYIGAIISAVPAVLVGFIVGPATALYVVLVFAAAHVLEGYLLTPVVQQKATHIPPALLVAAQGILGTLFGLAGVALAAPIVAIGLVVTRMYYLREVVGEPPEEPESAVAGVD